MSKFKIPGVSFSLNQAEENEKYDYIVDLKAKSASLTQKEKQDKLKQKKNQIGLIKI